MIPSVRWFFTNENIVVNFTFLLIFEPISPLNPTYWAFKLWRLVLSEGGRGWAVHFSSRYLSIVTKQVNERNGGCNEVWQTRAVYNNPVTQTEQLKMWCGREAPKASPLYDHTKGSLHHCSCFAASFSCCTYVVLIIFGPSPQESASIDFTSVVSLSFWPVSLFQTRHLFKHPYLSAESLPKHVITAALSRRKFLNVLLLWLKYQPLAAGNWTWYGLKPFSHGKKTSVVCSVWLWM